MSLANSVLEGDRAALSRLLSEIENDTTTGKEAVDALSSKCGNAHIIGVTGAAGAGKSSLIHRLVDHFISFSNIDKKRKIAILAIDPSSPISGGAVLGDRIRMRSLITAPGVFIRSMAERNGSGGVAPNIQDMISAFDAAGYGTILVETVGAGQSDIAIREFCHTLILTLAPGFGDDIQALKAGILEIADIYVLNKSDLPDAAQTEIKIRSVLPLRGREALSDIHDGSHLEYLISLEKKGNEENDISQWEPDLIRVSTVTGAGIPELAAEIDRHFIHIKDTGKKEWLEKQILEKRVKSLLREEIFQKWKDGISQEKFDGVISLVFERKISPHQAVDMLLSNKL